MKFIFLLPLLLLGGCMAFAPKDLKFERLEIVKLSAVPDAWPGLQKQSGAKLDQIDLLRLHFSSDTDLVKLAKQSDMHLSVNGSRCRGENGATAPIFVLSSLSVKGVPLRSAAYFQHPDIEHLRESNGRFIYSALIPLANEELLRLRGNASSVGIEPYLDLKTSSDDICVHVQGGWMWAGWSVKTNDVIAMRSDLVRASIRVRQLDQLP